MRCRPPHAQFVRHGYHHGNLREALIAAARRLIAEHGPQGFTLNEASRTAGVSPSAPYRHFRDRNALIDSEDCLVSLSDAELRQRTNTALDSFDGYAGVNNHMGSRFTAFRPGMETVLRQFKGRGLMFLDSRTSPQSVGDLSPAVSAARTPRQPAHRGASTGRSNSTRDMLSSLAAIAESDAR